MCQLLDKAVQTESAKALRRVVAAKSWWLVVGAACLVIGARAMAGQAPTVTIDEASQVTGASAMISGTVNPNGLTTWAWFRWGTSTSYNQTNFAYRLPASGTTLAVSNLLSFLSTNTTYHYQLVATNGAGQTFSPDMTVTTSSYVPTPVVDINPAINITDGSATITGTVDPNGYPVSVYAFWWYVATNGGPVTTFENSEMFQTLPAENGAVPVRVTVTNLMSNTAYHCQLSAINSINVVANSTNVGFTTLFAPMAITGPAADIAVDSVTMLGTLNPNGFDTAYYFEYGTSTAYGQTTVPLSVSAQNTPVDVWRAPAGLNPGTTYHYRLVATNSTGIYFGGDMSFTTASTIAVQGHTFTYLLNNGTVTITAYAGPAGAVTIPDTIAGLTVSGVADQVFFNLTNLTRITLPSGLTHLGSSCFAYCSSLANVTLPPGLTDLPLGVFGNCTTLASITIPDLVTNIGKGAFAGCGRLTNVIFGNRVLSLGSQAFLDCTNLTSVWIPASTADIEMNTLANDDNGAFAGCTGLKAINVDPQNSFYSSLDGVLFNKDRSELYTYPQSKPGLLYAVPDSVVVLGDSAFLNCSNLTDINIGTNVARISHWAFLGCSGLTKIVIPDSVTNIADVAVGCFGNCVDGGAFWGCTSLTNVVVGKRLSYLGIGALSGCGNLVSVYFKGDAPTPGTTLFYVDVFGNDPSTTVYYLPGTSGWNATYAGRPALLWNPQIQTADASFGFRSKGFGFNISGTAEIPVVIEACTSGVSGAWTPLQNCTLTNGQVYFNDSQWTNSPNRLYRVRSP